MSTYTETQASVHEMFDRAARLFQSAMEAGIKIQEESARSFSEMIEGLGSPGQLQEHAGQVMQSTIDTINHNLEETLQLMNENTRTSLELLDKAFGVLQATRADERQQKSREMWETAMGSLRRNTEVIVQANNRLFESWKTVASIIRQAEPPAQS